MENTTNTTMGKALDQRGGPRNWTPLTFKGIGNQIVTCTRDAEPNANEYTCRTETRWGGYETASAALGIVTAVILVLIAAWVIRGIMLAPGGARRSLGPAGAANLEAHYTVLSQADLDRALAQGQPVLGMVYAPWCGHCEAFMPRFKEAALAVHAARHGVTMAVIDGEAFPGIHSMADIRGYPTCVQIWEDGTATQRQPAARTAEAVAELAAAMAEAKAGKAQAGKAQAGKAQAGSAQAGSAQAGSAQAGSA